MADDIIFTPLRFRSLPGALRVRTPLDAPGASPAALRPAGPWRTAKALVRVVGGHPGQRPNSADNAAPHAGGRTPADGGAGSELVYLQQLLAASGSVTRDGGGGPE